MVKRLRLRPLRNLAAMCRVVCERGPAAVRTRPIEPPRAGAQPQARCPGSSHRRACTRGASCAAYDTVG